MSLRYVLALARIRRRPYEVGIALLAVGAMLVALVLWWLLHQHSGAPTSVAPPSAVPSPVYPGVLSSPGPHPSAPSGDMTEAVSGMLATGAPFGALPQGRLAGFPGIHTVLMRATSASGRPMMVLGYLVPTAASDQAWRSREVHSPWEYQTTAYGNRWLVAVFLQTSPDGDPLTCQIYIDGKLANQRSTSGPWGLQVCAW